MFIKVIPTMFTRIWVKIETTKRALHQLLDRIAKIVTNDL